MLLVRTNFIHGLCASPSGETQSETREQLCALELQSDALPEPSTIMIIAHQHLLQLVPPLGATIRPSHATRANKYNMLGQ